MISKEQICHDLAITYANTKITEHVSPDSVLNGFKRRELLLIYYYNAFEHLMKNYDLVLEKYKQRQERHLKAAISEDIVNKIFP